MGSRSNLTVLWLWASLFASCTFLALACPSMATYSNTNAPSLHLHYFATEPIVILDD